MISSGRIGSNQDDDRNNKIVVYGVICEGHFAEGESIYNLQIDENKPDDIAEYESFGKNIISGIIIISKQINNQNPLLFLVFI